MRFGFVGVYVYFVSEVVKVFWKMNIKKEDNWIIGMCRLVCKCFFFLCLDNWLYIFGEVEGYVLLFYWKWDKMLL